MDDRKAIAGFCEELEKVVENAKGSVFFELRDRDSRRLNLVIHGSTDWTNPRILSRKINHVRVSKE